MATDLGLRGLGHQGGAAEVAAGGGGGQHVGGRGGGGDEALVPGPVDILAIV